MSPSATAGCVYTSPTVFSLFVMLVPGCFADGLPAANWTLAPVANHPFELTREVIALRGCHKTERSISEIESYIFYNHIEITWFPKNLKKVC